MMSAVIRSLAGVELQWGNVSLVYPSEGREGGAASTSGAQQQQQRRLQEQQHLSRKHVCVTAR